MQCTPHNGKNRNKENKLAEKDIVEVIGVITEAHRGGLFSVDIEMGDQQNAIVARPAGKIRKFGIRLVVGDSVRVELSPYDLTKGRIIYRI